MIRAMLIALLLSGCATEYRAAAGAKATEAARSHAVTTRWAYCRSQSSGYMLDMPKAERVAFIEHCGGTQ